MAITYQKEKFADIMPELPDLFVEHWEHLAHHRDVIKLDPAWNEYLDLEKRGKLHIITVRKDGVLVGYAFGMLYHHLHYRSTLYAHSDMFIISKKARDGFASGVRVHRLLKEFLGMMRDLGAKKVYVSFKVDHDLTTVVERLGMKFVEKLYHIVF